MGPAEAPGAAARRRAALASTLLAALELEREGSAALSQAPAFDRIAVAPAALLDRACRGASPLCQSSCRVFRIAQ